MIHGPSGKYRFLAAFQKGARRGRRRGRVLSGRSGGNAARCSRKSLFGGEDAKLSEWLKLLRHRDASPHAGSATFYVEVILGSRSPAARRCRRHSATWPGALPMVPTPYFSSPEVFLEPQRRSNALAAAGAKGRSIHCSARSTTKTTGPTPSHFRRLARRLYPRPDLLSRGHPGSGLDRSGCARRGCRRRDRHHVGDTVPA